MGPFLDPDFHPPFPPQNPNFLLYIWSYSLSKRGIFWGVREKFWELKFLKPIDKKNWEREQREKIQKRLDLHKHKEEEKRVMCSKDFSVVVRVCFAWLEPSLVWIGRGLILLVSSWFASLQKVIFPSPSRPTSFHDVMWQLASVEYLLVPICSFLCFWL